MKGYFTTAEAAGRLGVCRSRVLALIAAGRLPTVQVYPRGPHLIRPRDLRLVAERRPGRPPTKRVKKNDNPPWIRDTTNQ